MRGDTDGRGWVPVLLPRGAVTPHATFSPAKPVRWMPDQIELQICA